MAKYEFLTCANEDWSGLYEAVWTLQNEDLAAELIKELLDEGLIQLGRERCIDTGKTDPRGRRLLDPHVTPLQPKEVAQVLGDPSSWDPYGPDDEGMCFWATEEGKRAWRRPNPN